MAAVQFRTRDDTFYCSPRWRRLRKRKLQANPLCEDPHWTHLLLGRPVLACEVDHKQRRRDFPELAFRWENLQSLCKRCHSRKTAMETQDA